MCVVSRPGYKAHDNAIRMTNARGSFEKDVEIIIIWKAIGD